ncbi:MAG: uridine diphosphate-N-acetylglucosamine-binding protein YvcK [Corynebacterium sp.]|nr:uridine diphosphate-N-acetylglucosamine-binding protein YvcK [Corynebacterium sp.]
MKIRSLTALGGGHGLFQTLRSARALNIEFITAVVTVADDGGSSGRIRRELGQSPPGDLRMALAALTHDNPDGTLWEGVLQHRFGGTGALAGHALGNLLLSGLTEFFGSQVQALDFVAKTAQCQGRVLPVCEQPLDIEADVSGLDDDPRIMLPVRGQVSVATTPGSVRRVRLIPDKPEVCRDAVQAILNADVVTLGPGSWFTSVIPNLLVPGIVDALANTSAKKIVVLNLTAEPGETAGFSAERHIHMLLQHAPLLQVDRIIVDAATIPTQRERAQLARAAAALGAEVAFHDVQEGTSNRHDPAKLAAALVSECEKG